jgi:hypothetical protein
MDGIRIEISDLLHGANNKNAFGGDRTGIRRPRVYFLVIRFAEN